MTDKKPILGNSKVTRRYQITIPRSVRERFSFEIGDLVVFTLSREGELVLRKVEF